MREIKIRPLWIGLSVVVAVLVAAASAAGIFLKSIYAQETASWAAQGIGQDFVNLAVAVPALLASAWFLREGLRPGPACLDGRADLFYLFLLGEAGLWESSWAPLWR